MSTDKYHLRLWTASLPGSCTLKDTVSSHSPSLNRLGLPR